MLRRRRSCRLRTTDGQSSVHSKLVYCCITVHVADVNTQEVRIAVVRRSTFGTRVFFHQFGTHCLTVCTIRWSKQFRWNLKTYFFAMPDIAIR